jgi:hypothetical protein
MRTIIKRLAIFSFLLLAAVVSHAQWVAVARAVSGRIQHMQQQSADGRGGYDVATVVIEANAQKVYETALQRIQAHCSEVKLTRNDARTRVVAFTNGGQTAKPAGQPAGRQTHAIGRSFHPRPCSAQCNFAGGQEHTKLSAPS